MKLQDFYRAIGPFLTGTASREEAVRALWGETPPARDASRLAIYGRFCRVHRFESVDLVYAEARAAVLRLRGLPAWEELVESYYRRFPMHHVELNENGDRLAEHMGEQPLPAWVAQLAELEWWEWRTRIAPDAPGDAQPDKGPLRLASTVEVRPFAHDLVEWLDGEPRAPEPEARQALVIFWRDGSLSPRRENASLDELQILKAVHEGAPPPAGETLDDLRAAGILLGRP
jgi:hypothetical protein